MTEKEWLELVLKTSREGGFPAMARIGDLAGASQCKYRTQEGLKCAVGLMIPDDKYDPEFEGLSLFRGALHESLPDWAQKKIYAVRCIQRCHDDLGVQLNGGWCHADFIDKLKKYRDSNAMFLGNGIELV